MKATGLVFKSRDYIGSVEPPATVLEDESRFGNDGAFKADGEPDWVQLPSGLWVMSFDGTDDNILIADNAALYPVDGTVEFWVYRDDRDNNQYIFCDHDSYTTRIYWATGADTIVPVSGTCYVDGLATTSASQQVWHHVAVSGIDLSGCAGGLYLARRSDGSVTYAYPGDIGEVRLCNRALSAEEIAAHYQATRHWFGV